MTSNQITASVLGVRPRSNSTTEANDIKNKVIAPLFQNLDPASPGIDNPQYFHTEQQLQAPSSSPSSSPLRVQIEAQPTQVIPPMPSAQTSPMLLKPIFEKQPKPSFIRRILNTIKENPKTFLALIFPITTIPTLIFIGIRYFYNNSKALTVESDTKGARASVSSSNRENRYSSTSHSRSVSSVENDVLDELILVEADINIDDCIPSFRSSSYLPFNADVS